MDGKMILHGLLKKTARDFPSITSSLVQKASFSLNVSGPKSPTTRARKIKLSHVDRRWEWKGPGESLELRNSLAQGWACRRVLSLDFRHQAWRVCGRSKERGEGEKRGEEKGKKRKGEKRESASNAPKATRAN